MLTESIRANGLREAIVLHPDGSVLDGRNPTKEGLLLRLKEHLVKEHLLKLQVQQKRSKTDKRVSKQALEETEAARARLRRGDVASFGVDPAAWGIVEALPEYFQRKEATATVNKQLSN